MSVTMKTEFVKKLLLIWDWASLYFDRILTLQQ
jgi:hypothetical protein